MPFLKITDQNKKILSDVFPPKILVVNHIELLGIQQHYAYLAKSYSRNSVNLILRFTNCKLCILRINTNSYYFH